MESHKGPYQTTYESQLFTIEIARGQKDDSVSDIETRVRTALAAEQSGYSIRGNNVFTVTGITVKNMDEARKRISMSLLFGFATKRKAVRIIKSLISQKHIAKAQDSEAESRIDYLADILGISKRGSYIRSGTNATRRHIGRQQKIYLLIY